MVQEIQKYISLSEATKLCKYSQEYLSLRVRQGKLKGVKFGRNWVTTKEWLDNYIQRVHLYKQELKKKRERKIKVRKVKKIEPPPNLPIGNLALPKKSILDILKINLSKITLSSKNALPPVILPRLAIKNSVAGLMILLLIIGLTFGQETLRNIGEGITFFLIRTPSQLIEGLDKSMQEIEFIGEELDNFVNETNQILALSAQKISIFPSENFAKLREGSVLMAQSLNPKIKQEFQVIAFLGLGSVWQETFNTFAEYGKYLIEQKTILTKKIKTIF